MNLKLSGLGAEPKKLIFLGILVVGGGYYVISSMSSSDGPATTPARPGAATDASPRVVTRQVSRTTRANHGVSVRTAEEFHPSMKKNRDDPPVDPNTVDPTLRLDLLAKLQKGGEIEAGRSLFDFGAAAPLVAVKKEPDKIVPKVVFRPQGPHLPPPPPTPGEIAAKEAASAPPIPLKFYGFVNRFKTGDRRAFFMDGEDIIVASEGQLVKNRYKIVKVGLTSAEVEDTQYKNHRQTLQIVEEAKEQGA
ncbi:MAG TPA: hypothetical protein VKU01_17905 [Bryobacteraceae bacterium]|nr:hypothetical protein [Bryobacteraceae bacterium]